MYREFQFIHNSPSRQKKQKKSLKSFEKKVRSSKLSKEHINKQAYNEYLKLSGEVIIPIDYQKFEADNEWDGLKGYVTNTHLIPALCGFPS